MIKKKYWALGLLLTGPIFYLWCFTANNEKHLIKKTSLFFTEPLERPVVEKSETPNLREPASTGYINNPSPVWQEKLEDSLKEQAGDSLKEIRIKKERSLVWNLDSSPIHVESVIVTLKNQEDVESSFRAIVDSQTGKVLETWDRTIFDPADVHSGVKIELDSRYTN